MNFIKITLLFLLVFTSTFLHGQKRYSHRKKAKYNISQETKEHNNRNTESLSISEACNPTIVNNEILIEEETLVEEIKVSDVIKSGISRKQNIVTKHSSTKKKSVKNYIKHQSSNSFSKAYHPKSTKMEAILIIWLCLLGVGLIALVIGLLFMFLWGNLILGIVLVIVGSILLSVGGIGIF